MSAYLRLHGFARRRVKALAFALAIVTAVLAAIPFTVLLGGTEHTGADVYVQCPPGPPPPPKTPVPDATKTLTPTGTPCKATPTTAPTGTDTPTPTDTPAVIIGGVAELPEVARAPAAATGSPGGSDFGLLAGVGAAVVVGISGLGGAAWFVRRRRAG